MDNRFVMELELDNSIATQELATIIGHNLRGGEVIKLVSDIGGGKTTLVKGVAKGAGSNDHVSSPSFTIRNDYQARNITIAHFDFYRLSEPGIVKDMLREELVNPTTVVIIEWASLVSDVLPVDHITIAIQATGLSSRRLNIDCPDRFAYLFEGAKP